MRKQSFLFLTLILYSFNVLAQHVYKQPLLTGQDPSVVYKNGFFYLIQSDGNIVIRKAETIEGLKTAPMVEVWDFECCNVWAPELQYLNGKWYIYYTKDDGNNDNHRMYVLESKTEDPLGEYALKGKIFDPNNDNWAIDGNVIEKDDGSLYFIWSGWEGKSNGQQNLYIAPMSNPYTISGPRVMISKPVYAWECQGMPINEGPQLLKRNGAYYIIYSASGSWTDDYCLGMISNKEGDLLNPLAWTKSQEPVFSKSPTAYGPGHHCMVEGPDGSCWNIYHANEVPGSGWAGRSIRVQTFTFDETNVPKFGTPFPTIMINDTLKPKSLRRKEKEYFLEEAEELQ